MMLSVLSAAMQVPSQHSVGSLIERLDRTPEQAGLPFRQTANRSASDQKMEELRNNPRKEACE
jgi:hypothetical protein